MASTRPRQETHLHFVGIGGIGMSGIAEVFLNQGYRVTGSDLSESETTKRLAQLGAKIAVGHAAENVDAAHVVVISSAVKPTNPEVVEARRRRIPVIPRAEMLGELMRGKTGIAVAGTHGKTTTTSMLATVLTHAKLDPTLVIGGKVDSLGGNAKLGQGEYVVAEADESDGSFLHLPATYGIVTNIDHDHLDHFGSLAAIEEAFVEFVGKLPFYGVAAICGEDAGVKRCLQRFTKPIVTYGFSREWDYCAEDVVVEKGLTKFTVFARKSSEEEHRELGRVELRVPGQHNVLNALAAIILASRVGIDFATVKQGLAEFGGVKRRFEERYRDAARNIRIIDDYGHHPTEIVATLAAARSVWKGRIVVAFQPHRYSRTVHCRDGFLSAFRDADAVWLTEIYAAGEDPIEGVSSETLAQDMARVATEGQTIVHVGDLMQAAEHASRKLKDGDLFLCMGAGSITKLPDLAAAKMGLK